jgi:hypothetical protein
MRKRRMTDDHLGHSAIEALRDTTDLPLRGATVQPLATLEIEGESRRTREPARYRYHVFQVNPPVALSSEIVPLGFACRCVFLRPQEIVPPTPESLGQPPDAPGKRRSLVAAPGGADLVTWSTRRIVEELISNQQVAEAVICRRGAGGPEFLMHRNANYGGYFLIAGRCRSEAEPRMEVTLAVEDDTGYRRRVEVGAAVVVEERHHSHRFQCERRFVHHLFPVQFPAVDLGRAGNDLDYSLDRSGLQWRWVANEQLDDPEAQGLSPTIAVLRNTLRQIAQQSGC